MKTRVCRCVVVAGLVLPARCLGGEIGKATEGEPSLHVGGGALVASKPYVGVDAQVYPVPMFAYEGKNLYVHSMTGGYRLLAGKGWSIGPIVQPRFDGYDADDSSFLEGMDDRKWSIDAGVGVSWRTGIGLFELSYVTDILGRSDGQELQLIYTVMCPLAGFDIAPSVGVKYKSDDLVDYYYGVEPDEIAFDRWPYEGGAATDPFVRLALRRKLGERWSLILAGQYEWLADDITDSPIVDSDYQASFLAGLMYSW